MLNRNSTLGPGRFGWDQQCALKQTLPVEGTMLWHAGAVDQPCSRLISRRLDEIKLEDDFGYTRSALQQLRNACRGGPLRRLFGFTGLFLWHLTTCQNWSGRVCQALSNTKAGQPFQLFLAKYILRIKKNQTTKLKPEVPTSPRAGGSAFLLQQHICTGSKTAAETMPLPGSPARPALGISAQTPDPAPAPCFCTHSRPGCNTITDSSVTGLSYSSWHGDRHRSLPLTPSHPSPAFCPERGWPYTAPGIGFNLSFSLCSGLTVHPTGSEPAASPGSDKPCACSWSTLSYPEVLEGSTWKGILQIPGFQLE